MTLCCNHIVLSRLFFGRHDFKLDKFEFSTIFAMTCQAFEIVLDIPIPKVELIVRVARKAFIAADIDGSGYLSIDELELWCYYNEEWNEFVNHFSNHFF